MRLALFIFIFAISIKAACNTLYYTTIRNDSINLEKEDDVPEAKTILIGNVTEVTYGYNWLFPEAIYLDSLNAAGSARMHSVALTQYFIVNNFLIQSGLEYNALSSNYAFDNRSINITSRQVEIIDTINIHYYIVNGDSIPEYVTDKYTITENDTVVSGLKYKGTIKSSLITIPLNIGYRWRFEKFALYGKIGARFNFITSTKGKVYFAGKKLWEDMSNQIDKKFYVSGTASVVFEYPFSVLGSLIMEPEYRYSFHSGVNPEVARNYHQFGIRLGIQFWF
jgi:hypothetical protein